MSQYCRISLLRRGFTIIEIMVVVAILVVLIAILVPAIGHVKGVAVKATATAQLSALQTALQAYYGDCGNVYPPSASGLPVGTPYGGLPTGRGAAMLAQGLQGYMPGNIDGAGPDKGDQLLGFRTRQGTMGGKIYGPYAPGDPKGYRQNSTGPAVYDETFIDPWGNEILYYRSARATVVENAPAVTTIFSTGTTFDYFFNNNDCATTYSGILLDAKTAMNTTPAFAKLITDSSSPTPNNYGTLTGGRVVGSDSYLLISAGPDGVYFTADDIVVGSK